MSALSILSEFVPSVILVRNKANALFVEGMVLAMLIIVENVAY